MLLDRARGVMLGLALGDALGARHEGGILERMLWHSIGTTPEGSMRWTDDTQMSLDLAESVLAVGELDQDDLAQRFAQSYRWSRGYGPGTARMLLHVRRGMDWRVANRSVYPGGSFGNGAAMRAPVLALVAPDNRNALDTLTVQSAVTTHANGDAIVGALLIARATRGALVGDDVRGIWKDACLAVDSPRWEQRIELASQWLAEERATTPIEVASRLGNGVAALDSCVSAAYLGVRFLDRPVAELHDFVATMGGDSDSIGAMAGAIWGAYHGASALPRELLGQLEDEERIRDLADALVGRHRASKAA